MKNYINMRTSPQPKFSKKGKLAERKKWERIKKSKRTKYSQNSIELSLVSHLSMDDTRHLKLEKLKESSQCQIMISEIEVFSNPFLTFAS